MQKIQGGVTTNVILEKRQSEKLEEIGARFGLKKAQALRLLLDMGLESYSVYEGLGVAKLAEIAKKAKKACRKDVQPSLI